MSKPEAPEDVIIPGVMNLSRMTKEEIDEAVIRSIEQCKNSEVMSVEESIDRICAAFNIPIKSCVRRA